MQTNSHSGIGKAELATVFILRCLVFFFTKLSLYVATPVFSRTQA